jgi:hypothetical protein
MTDLVHSRSDKNSSTTTEYLTTEITGNSSTLVTDTASSAQVIDTEIIVMDVEMNIQDPDLPLTNNSSTSIEDNITTTNQLEDSSDTLDKIVMEEEDSDEDNKPQTYDLAVISDQNPINYAASSRGGRIASDNLEQQGIRLTSPPVAASKGFFSKLRLKVKLLQKDSNPQSLVQDFLPNDQGSRYCIAGNQGQVTVTLRHAVHVTAVSIFNPTAGRLLEDVTVLPRSFRLIGWTSDDEGNHLKHDLGIYDNSDTITVTENTKQGGHWLTFSLPTNDMIPTLRAVTLMVLSNHGNEKQTCLYRVQVSGHEQLSTSLTESSSAEL